MKWIDVLLIVVLGLAAFKGFQRGFVLELASLVALVAGIWAAVHLSDRVAGVLGIDEENTILAFTVTFLVVLVGIHLFARALTALIDIAQLGLPNKVAGAFFGVLRSTFLLSVALNLLMGFSGGAVPSAEVRDNAMIYGPIQGFAPLVMPSLGETKWMRKAVEDLKNGVVRMTE